MSESGKVALHYPFAVFANSVGKKEETNEWIWMYELNLNFKLLSESPPNGSRFTWMREFWAEGKAFFLLADHSTYLTPSCQSSDTHIYFHFRFVLTLQSKFPGVRMPARKFFGRPYSTCLHPSSSWLLVSNSWVYYYNRITFSTPARWFTFCFYEIICSLTLEPIK